MSSNLSEGASDIIEHTNATHRGAGAKGVHAKEPEESNCKTKRKRSKKLDAVEIEEAISAPAEQPFDAHEFAFAFLQAFGLAAIAVAVNWQMRIVDPVKGIDFDKVGLRRWLVDHEIASPERGPDTAGCHHFSSRLRMYGFHFIGVTVCSVPLLESIQPAAVRRHEYGSRYHPAVAAFAHQQRHVFTDRRNIERTPVISVRTHNHEQSAGSPLFCAPMAPAAWQTLPRYASLRPL
jgi:hypothetical protein